MKARQQAIELLDTINARRRHGKKRQIEIIRTCLNTFRVVPKGFKYTGQYLNRNYRGSPPLHTWQQIDGYLTALWLKRYLP